MHENLIKAADCINKHLVTLRLKSDSYGLFAVTDILIFMCALFNLMFSTDKLTAKVQLRKKIPPAIIINHSAAKLTHLLITRKV